MRLTCPNCGARYEVADTMVPPEGRDVQCSNCSTTWFQPGRRTDRPTAVSVERGTTPADAVDPRPPAPPPPPEPHPRPEPPTPEPQPEPQPEPPAAEAAEAADAHASAPPSAALPPRRTLDPELRSILQEEAEREALLRRAEADPVETQAEMPLGQEPEDLHRARRRAELEAARDAFEADPSADEAAPHSGAGGQSARDLFPDIDEINSTLRDTADRSDTEADASDIDTLEALPRRRRGARIGFFTVLLIAGGVVALYANADRLATAVPTLAPVLDGYVEALNGARFWLDDMAQGLAGDTPEG